MHKIWLDPIFCRAVYNVRIVSKRNRKCLFLCNKTMNVWRPNNMKIQHSNVTRARGEWTYTMYVYIKGTITDNVNNAVLFLFRFLFPVQSIILYYFGLLKRFCSPLLLSCDLYHSFCFSLFPSHSFAYVILFCVYFNGFRHHALLSWSYWTVFLLLIFLLLFIFLCVLTLILSSRFVITSYSLWILYEIWYIFDIRDDNTKLFVTSL